MYSPEFFNETSTERIVALIENYPLGLMITAPEGVPFVSHLPFLFEPSIASQGQLLGHMARANPQWQHFLTNDELLVVFQGPDAYVSPTWYSSPGVPTWNYAVVHIKGKLRLIEDEASLKALVIKLSQAHETQSSSLWQPKLTDEQLAKLLQLIVGFQIDVTDIQAKFKLSQNRLLVDQQSVIEQLRRSTQPNAMAVAGLMSSAIGVV